MAKHTRASYSRIYSPEEDGYVDEATGRVQHKIHGNSTAVEIERRNLLKQTGAKEDRGQAVQDLRSQASGGTLPQRAATPFTMTPTPNSSASMKVNSPAIQTALDSVPSTATTMKETANGYGSGSVRFAPAGEKKTPLIAAGPTAGGENVGDTGPKHAAPLRWDEQVVKDHPDVGVAGSAANRAFIAAHESAMQQGPNADGSARPAYDPAQHASALAEKTLAPLYLAGTANRGGTTGAGTQGPPMALAAKPGKEAVAKAGAALDETQANALLTKRAATPVPPTPEVQGGIPGAITSVKKAASSAVGAVGDFMQPGYKKITDAITGTPGVSGGGFDPHAYVAGEQARRAASPAVVSPVPPTPGATAFAPTQNQAAAMETEAEKLRKRTAGRAPYVP